MTRPETLWSSQFLIPLHWHWTSAWRSGCKPWGRIKFPYQEGEPQSQSRDKRRAIAVTMGLVGWHGSCTPFSKWASSKTSCWEISEPSGSSTYPRERNQARNTRPGAASATDAGRGSLSLATKEVTIEILETRWPVTVSCHHISILQEQTQHRFKAK